MNTERTAFLAQLAEAFESGDGRAAAILRMFRPWWQQLLQDSEAAKHEPGSAEYVARMSALRRLCEGTV